MAVEKVSDSMAQAIAASVGYPDPSTAGTYVVYQNHRYLLAVQNGKYAAWDISVYADNGTLVTEATDVFLNALLEAATQSTTDIGKILAVAVIVWAVYLGLSLYAEIK